MVAPADDVDVLLLERLVRLEEMLDLDQAVRPDLFEAFDVLLMWSPSPARVPSMKP